MKKILFVFAIVSLIAGCNLENSKHEIQEATSFEESLYEEIKKLRKENEELKNKINSYTLTSPELETTSDPVENNISEERTSLSINSKEEFLSVPNESPLKDIFNLKRECAESESDIINEINEYPNYRKGDPVLEEVFYSPKRNSCLYVFRYWPMGEWCEINKDSMSYDDQIKYCFMKNKVLTDFFTKEVIMERDTAGARACDDESPANCDIIYQENERFDELLESLK